MNTGLHHILLLLGLAVVVGCRDMGHTPGKNDGGQVLDLSVSIEEGASKAPITGTAFANGTHLFGLAVTKADGVTAYEAGSGNVWASAVVAGAVQTWTYKWGAMSVAGTVLPLLSDGDPMQVAGYYPYNASAGVLASRDGGRLNVPFDLTTTAEQSNQTDVLYSGVQSVAYASGARQSVALSFRHVYALMEFQVKLKQAGGAASITKVEVCNKAGKAFLSSKGFFSPYTGALTASTAGNVSLTTSTALNGSTYATIRVMVPPTLLAGYADGDIYVQMYDGGVADPKQFPILKAYLTQSGMHGLVGGGRYSYKLLYGSTVNGSITVVGWSSTVVADETLGSGPLPYVEIDGVKWAKGNLIADGANGCKIGAPTDYGLYFHFGSLVGWSGGNVTNGDGTGQGSPTTLAVKVRPSGYNGNATWPAGYYEGGTAGTEYSLPTTDNAVTGVGDPCRVYLGAPWQIPTATEMSALFAGKTAETAWSAIADWKWQATPAGASGFSSLFFPTSGFRNPANGSLTNVTTHGNYWSSSVSNTAQSYFLTLHSNSVTPQYQLNRPLGLSVRCVISRPTYLDPSLEVILKYGVAPYGNTEAQSGSYPEDIINATSTSYNAWKGTVGDVANGGNGAYVEPTEVNIDEQPYFQFQVSNLDDATGKSWQQARQVCWDKAPAGAWRLPRAVELVLMYANSYELEKEGGIASLSGIYWSASEYDETSALKIWSDDTEDHKAPLKSEKCDVRCIREVL